MASSLLASSKDAEIKYVDESDSEYADQSDLSVLAVIFNITTRLVNIFAFNIRLAKLLKLNIRFVKQM
eukprot:10643733-Heterocapsa_arctica.AAC.1